LDHLWLGTGLGTFVWSFPPYRDAQMSIIGIWDRAHNTWLELASDLGLPLAGIILAGWMVMIFILYRGTRIRRRDLALPAAGLSIALLSGLHSLIDFSLQIPGFAITAFALIGAGLAQSFPTAQPDIARTMGQFRNSEAVDEGGQPGRPRKMHLR
jgi:O-antigen ligase